MKKILFVFCLGLVSVAYGQCISGDCVNGQGTYTEANGDKYVGEWKDNNRYGQGTMTFANGDKYVGEWKYDKKDGQGTYTKNDGSIYHKGLWQNGDPVWCIYGNCNNGKGEMAWGMDSTYVGDWLNNKRDGQGTFTVGKGEFEGDKYVGEWKDGKKHGQGTETFVNGNNKYVGEWKDGKKHGQGTETDFDYEYVGEWKDGKKHGQGTETDFNNGNKYVGEWKDGKKYGQGTYTYVDGRTESGYWKKSKFKVKKK